MRNVKNTPTRPPGWSNRVGFANARRVWSAVTRHPHASIRELAHFAGLSLETTRHHLDSLEAAGYIDSGGYTLARTRRVLVPCGVSHEC